MPRPRRHARLVPALLLAIALLIAGATVALSRDGDALAGSSVIDGNPSPVEQQRIFTSGRPSGGAVSKP
jgi:hypothetical protein